MSAYLPLEILASVIEFCDKRTLFALCQTSAFCYRYAVQLLYKSLKIARDDRVAWENLARGCAGTEWVRELIVTPVGRPRPILGEAETEYDHLAPFTSTDIHPYRQFSGSVSNRTMRQIRAPKIRVLEAALRRLTGLEMIFWKARAQMSNTMFIMLWTHPKLQRLWISFASWLPNTDMYFDILDEHIPRWDIASIRDKTSNIKDLRLLENQGAYPLGKILWGNCPNLETFHMRIAQEIGGSSFAEFQEGPYLIQELFNPLRDSTPTMDGKWWPKLKNMVWDTAPLLEYTSGSSLDNDQYTISSIFSLLTDRPKCELQLNGFATLESFYIHLTRNQPGSVLDLVDSLAGRLPLLKKLHLWVSSPWYESTASGITLPPEDPRIGRSISSFLSSLTGPLEDVYVITESRPGTPELLQFIQKHSSSMKNLFLGLLPSDDVRPRVRTQLSPDQIRAAFPGQFFTPQEAKKITAMCPKLEGLGLVTENLENIVDIISAALEGHTQHNPHGRISLHSLAVLTQYDTGFPGNHMTFTDVAGDPHVTWNNELLSGLQRLQELKYLRVGRNFANLKGMTGYQSAVEAPINARKPNIWSEECLLLRAGEFDVLGQGTSIHGKFFEKLGNRWLW